jgi:hypothetical protein
LLSDVPPKAIRRDVDGLVLFIPFAFARRCSDGDMFIKYADEAST